MDYSGIKMVGLLKAKMDYLGQRQAVLARDISMIDTPGFKAKDLQEFSYGKQAASFADEISLRITSPGHMSTGGGTSGGKKYKSIEPGSFETKPVGNNVTTEDIMMKMNDTAMDYATATNLYAKMNNMFKIAIGNR